MTHWPLRLTGYICCHRHISGNHGKESPPSSSAIRGELDGDGGASDWSGGGATRDTGGTPGATVATGATEALGVGAVIDLHPVRAAKHFKCCKCQCDRFPGC